MSDGFEPRAAAWPAWAGTPGHDAHRDTREAFFALVPAPGRTARSRSGAARAA
jgi:hypothetical protein